MAPKGLNHWLLYLPCGVVIICVVVVYDMKRYNTTDDTNPLYQQTGDTDGHSSLGKLYVQYI